MHYVQELKDNNTVCNINKMLMLQVEHLITLRLSSLNQASGVLRGPFLLMTLWQSL